MRLLLVFLKEPTPGKVKTRLAADIGEEKAVSYYKALVAVLLCQLQGLQDTRIRFCYAPDDASEAIRFWLLPQMNATTGASPSLFKAPISAADSDFRQEIDFSPQGDGDLGERMCRAFDSGFSEGFTEIAVIGTDCPECGSRWINAAFSQLSTAKAKGGIIGPCPDGGYYLLALRSPAPELFTDIPWSESNVLAKTLSAAEKSQRPLYQLPPLNDIDMLGDWQQLLRGPLGPSLKKLLDPA